MDIGNSEGALLVQATRAIDLFLKWKGARPLLTVSTCPYARSLIQFVLDVYEQLYDDKDEPDEYEDYVNFLRKLLTDPPPHHTPPRAQQAPGGVLYLTASFLRA